MTRNRFYRSICEDSENLGLFGLKVSAFFIVPFKIDSSLRTDAFVKTGKATHNDAGVINSFT